MAGSIRPGSTVRPRDGRQAASVLAGAARPDRPQVLPRRAVPDRRAADRLYLGAADPGCGHRRVRHHGAGTDRPARPAHGVPAGVGISEQHHRDRAARQQDVRRRCGSRQPCSPPWPGRRNREIEDAPVSQAGEEVYLPAPGQAVARYERTGDDFEWADLRSVVSWVRSHRVLVVAVVLIAAQLAWKAQFLSHLYFRQDDFHDLDLAVDHPLTWSYLTYIGSGHLIIGLRVVAWLAGQGVAAPTTGGWHRRSAWRSWPRPASPRCGCCASLFGERPFILIPLGDLPAEPADHARPRDLVVGAGIGAAAAGHLHGAERARALRQDRPDQRTWPRPLSGSCSGWPSSRRAWSCRCSCSR